MICKYCGTINPEGSSYCMECGKHIQKPAPLFKSSKRESSGERHSVQQNRNIKGTISNLLKTRNLYADHTGFARKEKQVDWEIDYAICKDIVAWISELSSRDRLAGELLINSELDEAKLSLDLKNNLIWELEYFQVAVSLFDESHYEIGETVIKTEDWLSGETQNFTLDVPEYTKYIRILAPSLIYRVSSESVDSRRQDLLEGDKTLCKYCREATPRDSLFCNHCGMRLMTAEQRDLLKLKDAQRAVSNEKEIFDSFLMKYAARLEGDEELLGQVKLLEEKSEKAFARISERPEYLRHIKKYSNIYLPKLSNAIDTYFSVKDGGVSPEGVADARNRLMQAFEIGDHSMQMLIESLYQSDQLDVETDLAVLKQMFLNGHEEIIEFDEREREGV